jgi:hypothetical protein
MFPSVRGRYISLSPFKNNLKNFINIIYNGRFFGNKKRTLNEKCVAINVTLHATK